MLANTSPKLLLALPRQPSLRAQFSSASRIWPYKSLRCASPEESEVAAPTSSSSGPAETNQNTDVASMPRPQGRYRVIKDTLSRTTRGALATALSKNRPGSARLPKGRHGDFLVHFGGGTQHPSQFLKDGTDTFHWPGKPWSRRVWAGGSIYWGSNWKETFSLPILVEAQSEGGREFVLSQSLKCEETIESVENKGVVGSGREKILVKTARTYLPEHLSGQESTSRKISITERRDLVFMPGRSADEARAAQALPDRIIKPTVTPDASISLTPRQPLLAEFSCLTHNAHRIHLDRGYAASEGFRNLVVHGPLSLYLMLTFLESVIPKYAQISRFDYRNLAPLFCDEEMTVCARKTSDVKLEAAAPVVKETEGDTEAATPDAQEANEIPHEQQTWDVWITNSLGGYAVKGTASVRLNRYRSKELNHVFADLKLRPVFCKSISEEGVIRRRRGREINDCGYLRRNEANHSSTSRLDG